MGKGVLECNGRSDNKIFAPGEARTLDLRISLSVLTYKYDALTDCATGAWTLARRKVIESPRALSRTHL